MVKGLRVTCVIRKPIKKEIMMIVQQILIDSFFILVKMNNTEKTQTIQEFIGARILGISHRKCLKYFKPDKLYDWVAFFLFENFLPQTKYSQLILTLYDQILELVFP